MAHVEWYIEGRSFGNCNCNYGCPCQFEDLPTHGHCTGFEVLHVDKGHFGDLDLTGTLVALVYAWPGPIYEGNGAMQVIVDDRATPEQHDVLSRLLQGEETDPEATHWWVYRAMCSTVHDSLSKRINFEVDIDARKANVAIPGLLRSTGRPIQAPHGGGEHRVRIDLPNGIEFRLAEIGSGSSHATGAIKFNLSDCYGQWTVLRHGPHGVPGQT